MERTLMFLSARRLGYKDELGRYLAQHHELQEIVKDRTKDLIPQMELCEKEIGIRRGAILALDTVMEYTEKRLKSQTEMAEKEVKK